MTQDESRGKKILLVDDDESLLEIYGRKFMEEGFEVAVATDGQEAWDLIQKGYRPDVIFTGILMPRMTGFELVENLQKNTALAKIPVAISSHRNLVEDRKRARELAVDDFIPQGTTTLAEVVRRIKLLLGIKEKFRIVLRRDNADAEDLIRLLELQQGISCRDSKEVILEFEPKAEKNEFNVRLWCE